MCHMPEVERSGSDVLGSECSLLGEQGCRKGRRRRTGPTRRHRELANEDRIVRDRFGVNPAFLQTLVHLKRLRRAAKFRLWYEYKCVRGRIRCQRQLTLEPVEESAVVQAPLVNDGNDDLIVKLTLWRPQNIRSCIALWINPDDVLNEGVVWTLLAEAFTVFEAPFGRWLTRDSHSQVSDALSDVFDSHATILSALRGRISVEDE